MVKVLHAVHSPKTGITGLIENILGSSATLNVRSSVFLLDAVDADASQFSGLAEDISTGGRSGRIRAWQAFRHAIARSAPDIIHTHSYLPSVLASLLSPDIPQVRTIHSPYPYFSSSSPKAAFKRASENLFLERSARRVVCVSHGVQREVPYRLRNVALSTITNGINIERIVDRAGARKSKQEMFGVDEQRFVVAAIGRIENQKGFDVLLQALTLVSDDVRNCMLVALIGDGSERSKLEEFVNANGLTRCVQFLGFQSNPYPFLLASDAYICSSRFEGFSVALCEAMSLGLPVATTSVGGAEDIIVDGESGIIIPELTPPAVAAAIMHLQNDPALRLRLAATARQVAVKSLHIQNTADAYASVYREVARAL